MGEAKRTGVLLFCLLLGLGCTVPPDDPGPGPAPDPVPFRKSFTAGRSVQDRPIRCHVLGSGPDTILVLASIHGNEGAGTPLVERLLSVLESRPSLLKGRRAVLVPVANPDGLAKGTRRNARRVDLNRNFPARNFRGGSGGRRALSEPETVILDDLITEYRPNRVVTLHQQMRLIDWDGPGEALARAMATEVGLPARKLGPRSGSMGSYVGVDLGIPIVTVEMPRMGGVLDPDVLWKTYGRMLLLAVTWSGESR